MPYKIYTYEDPYKLDQTDFWDEISALPHFCVARTLVNGLKDVIKDSIYGLLCPLDDLVSHAEVYKHWTDNISLRVQQYSALTAIFNRELEADRIDKSFHMALSQNQNHFLDAIRLFIELGISLSSIDESKGNKEQRLFVSVLRELSGTALFRFPDTPNRDQLHTILVSLAQKELEDYDQQKHGSQQDRPWYEQAIKTTEQQPLSAIVVHGVHQFSPAELRLLMDMEKMGITIIFLFNYQKEYPEIYSSWGYIYKCFDVPFHHDGNIVRYESPSMQTGSNALACAIGELCEGKYNAADPRFQRWYQLYKEIKFLEFANITEYAHFVSNNFDSAIKKYLESLKVMERGTDTWSNAAVLRMAEEQVYTASRDVHTLLKLYYPEFAKDRHFLSYPIGQFFSAIYRLWDYERGAIIIDIPALRECLSSHVLNSGPGEELLRTFSYLENLFEPLSTYEEFHKRIAGDYLKKYESVNRARPTDPIFQLRNLSIYNKYKVSKRDIQVLIKAIEEINEIATYLFSLDNTHEDFISFGKHFHNLEDFLKQHDFALANEEERALITALQLRLDAIQPSRSTFSGTFRDLKEGLYYYLKQKNDDVGADWIVKNFEQIDGDILQSKRQVERGEKKIYHFACLSDRDLNCGVDDLLPWPLTESFIRHAYAPVDLQYQVYYTAISERGNFLRYALFYGLCFNRCDARLSYVKQYGDEITEPYALLPILGLKAKGGVVEREDRGTLYSIAVSQTRTAGVHYDRFEMMSMFLCPYRFFLDYVMEDAPVVHGTFLYQKFYENLLIAAVWKRIGGQQQSLAVKHLDQVLGQESAALRPYFSFWKDTELYDLGHRAKNYLIHDIIGRSKGDTVESYAESHISMRRLFGKARFDVDIVEREPVNPYKKFEELASRSYPRKIYRLHKLPKPEQKQADKPLSDELRSAAKEYLNQEKSKEKGAIPSDWCQYCVHRGVCMESFLLVE